MPSSDHTRAGARRATAARTKSSQAAQVSDRLRATLAPHPPRKKYLVGVSGGRDSMVLLHLLVAHGYDRLVVCHLDHRLRGRASAADARLVERTAAKLGLRCEMGAADVSAFAAREKLSLETAAREARHAFFRACARGHRTSQIFLAHHAGDQVETILFNFLRGTGAAGLGGMKPQSVSGDLTFLRPLLDLSREEIALVAAEGKIPFREDASNASDAHTRNRLRLNVLPAIREAMGPSVDAAILRAGTILRDEAAWMASLVPEQPPVLNSKDLAALPVALQRRTVHRWLKEQGIDEPGFQETQAVLSLLNDGSGPAKVNLPGNRHARRRSCRIFLEP